MPAPCTCPNCKLEAPCIDWNEVHNGIGTEYFDYQYECPICGVFAPTTRMINLGTSRVDREYVWRDGEPPDAKVLIAGIVARADAQMAEVFGAD